MKVLVLGAYGAVGAQIVNGLRASGGHAIAAGAEDPELVSLITEAGAAVVDITATASYVAALQTLTWLPGGSRAPRLHLPGSDRWRCWPSAVAAAAAGSTQAAGCGRHRRRKGGDLPPRRRVICHP